MFKLTLLFLWPRFYPQTSSLSSPFVKYLYKYVLRFCSLVAMLPRRRRTGRKAGGVSCFRFQNECNKVEIALRVVQFWSEIKLVITNRTPASRSCDFVITRLISDQIALHSVQLPLLIALFLTNQNAGNTIDFKMNVIKELIALLLTIHVAGNTSDFKMNVIKRFIH